MNLYNLPIMAIQDLVFDEALAKMDELRRVRSELKVKARSEAVARREKKDKKEPPANRLIEILAQIEAMDITEEQKELCREAARISTI